MDGTGTPAAGRGRLRASHADREQVVDTLKAAFVQGLLAQDELDARVGQALAARTYAELAALTADLPPEPDRAMSPAPAPAPAQPRPRNRAAARAVQAGAGAITALILAIGVAAVATGHPVMAAVAAVAIVIFAAAVTAFVASLIAVTVKLESLYRSRSRRRLPRGPASGPPGPASSADGPPDPASRPPGLASGADGRRRHPHGSLAVGRSPALSPGGRTDRRLAAGHGRPNPAGLVLAGQAGCIRRGRPGPGLGHRRAGDVLRGGVPDHRRAALARRGPGRRALDGRSPGGVRPEVGGLRAAHRGRRLGRRPARAGRRGRRRAGQGPGAAGPRNGRRPGVGRPRRGALARPDRDGAGHGRRWLPHADTGRRLPRPGGRGTGRACGRLAAHPGRGRARGNPVVPGPGVGGRTPR